MNYDYYLMVLSVVCWALSGIFVITNFLEHDYLRMGIAIGMLITNAWLYTMYKRRL